MTDTHTHIYTPDFEGNGEAAYLRAREAGVDMMVLPNCNEESAPQILDLYSRHPDNIRIRIGKHCRFICDPDFTSEADSSCYMVKIIEKKSFNARRNLITACWSCLSTFFCGMPNCSAISL